MIFSICYREMQSVIVRLSMCHHGIISSLDLELEAYYRGDVLQTMWRQQSQSLAICTWNAIIIIIIIIIIIAVSVYYVAGWAMQKPSDHMNNNRCYVRCTR